MSDSVDQPNTFTPDHSGTWEVEFTLRHRKNGMEVSAEQWRYTVLGWAVTDRGRPEWPRAVEPIVIDDEGSILSIEDVRSECADVEAGLFLGWRLVRIRPAEA